MTHPLRGEGRVRGKKKSKKGRKKKENNPLP